MNNTKIHPTRVRFGSKIKQDALELLTRHAQTEGISRTQALENLIFANLKKGTQ
jgi:hypothetical protein